MGELTRSQKDHKNVQEWSGCVTCRYAAQSAIKNYTSCCTYGFKLKFDVEGKCSTKEIIK